MLRPRLRPTLSRKVKYWGIAPKAQKKLGREARRGSHDLRKLVGHANFLDVLVSELDISDDEDEPSFTVQDQSLAISDETKDETVADESDDNDSSSDDGWQEYDDTSDDEYHTLMRTVSGRLSTASVHIPIEGQDTTELMKMESEREGYFRIESPGSTGLTISDVSVLGKAISVEEEDKKDAIVSVAVVSPNMTPLASPTEDIVPSGAG